MEMMIRGTTVPILLDFSGEDVDFTSVDTILVTLTQWDVSVTVTPTVVDETTLQIELTQVQSLGFKLTVGYPLNVQVNFLEDGVRYASEVTAVTVGKQIYDEVMQ